MEEAQVASQGVELSLTGEGCVAVLLINRPAARNALNSGVIQELDKAVQMLSADESVRVVVLAGASPGFVPRLPTSP